MTTEVVRTGLGNRLVYYSSRVQMDNFFAIIVMYICGSTTSRLK